LSGGRLSLEALQQALARAATGQGQVVALLGEPGVGKSRLVYEFLHSHHTQGWLRLESSSVSYGKATAYLPVRDLLTAYCRIEDRDDLRTVRAKITGHVLTLDEALQDTVPVVLALFEALPVDSPFLALDPLQRRRRTLEALKRILLRESQVQPLLLVFEDLHWIDGETQAVLDMLVEPADRSGAVVGQLSPRVSARLGQQNVLHAAPARPPPRGERGQLTPGAPGE
jgi:predicted ATPase